MVTLRAARVGIRLLLDVSDYESAFDRKTSGPDGSSAAAPRQHDLVISAGVRIGIH
jgi:hypothetical protein